MTEEQRRKQLDILYALSDCDDSSDYTSDDEPVPDPMVPPPTVDTELDPPPPPGLPEPPLIRKIWAKLDLTEIPNLGSVVLFPALEFPF